MRVVERPRDNGVCQYYLENDDGEIVCCYGTEPPTFHLPLPILSPLRA
jgi:hypothetical protein